MRRPAEQPMASDQPAKQLATEPGEEEEVFEYEGVVAEQLKDIQSKLDGIMERLERQHPAPPRATAPAALAAAGAPMDSDAPVDAASALQLATPEQLRATLEPLLDSLHTLQYLSSSLLRAFRSRRNFPGPSLLHALAALVLEVDKAGQATAHLGRPLDQHIDVLGSTIASAHQVSQLRVFTDLFSPLRGHGFAPDSSDEADILPWEDRNHAYTMLMRELGMHMVVAEPRNAEPHNAEPSKRTRK